MSFQIYKNIFQKVAIEIVATKKAEKPSWANSELNAAIKRRDGLAHDTGGHRTGCACNGCIEYFALDHQLDLFTQDEKAIAVSMENQGRGDELVNPKIESGFIRL